MTPENPTVTRDSSDSYLEVNGLVCQFNVGKETFITAYQRSRLQRLLEFHNVLC